MFALSGTIRNTGLVEVPIGIPLRTIIEDIGGGAPEGHEIKAVQIGGPSGGCIPRAELDVPADHGSLQRLGAMMGSGGMVVMDERSCMVGEAFVVAQIAPAVPVTVLESEGASGTTLHALANQAMAQSLGQPAEALLGAPAERLLGFPELAGVGELLAQDAPEYAVRELDRGDHCSMASVAAFRSDSGEVLGRILTIADTTPLRRMALEKSRFIRTMVHELRAPLGAIRSLVEVAVDGCLGPDLAAYQPLLARAGARIDGLAELIGDLLSFLQIDLERQPPIPPLGSEIAAAVAATVEEHRARIDARGLRWSVELAPDLPNAAIGEEDLRTVLRNLVGNATKYNRDEGSLSVRGETAAGFVMIAVQDTGIGIRASNLPRLFDEFYREPRPETRAVEGNGLGLAIVRRLVERVGGTIDVASVEGEGTTFAIRLPIAGLPAPLPERTNQVDCCVISTT
ncbi:MAG: SLBB domain-containing protein [Polyangiaceae bacterium]|nr:SLBB domain-containing protein [Polyangiaceae bacterium]